MKDQLKPRNQQGGALVNLIVLVCVLALGALMYFARHPIMRYAAESWVIDEPTPHADAIVVLGDDNFYGDRATRATELFRQGVAPVVVASGRRLRPSASVSELIEHDLIERGVPKEKVLRFTYDGDDTVGAATALAKYAEGQRWKSVVIVTSNYHTRRARYVFRKVFPAKISVSVAAARDGDFQPERWWERRESMAMLGREILGMVEAMCGIPEK
jgi:uncharacterized SAM-binding protein YcdF (DUF218 family)